ncbi:MAG: hypothetical protein EPO32_08885 [Anaerolineae bacterium]|nr:MAG: hypothetical protein EPO32_08885 [Anaerolineae bacterium]
MLLRLRALLSTLNDRLRLYGLTRGAARLRPAAGARTVAVFNASARVHGISLNAGFQLLTAWGLRLAGLRVVHFVCKAGMSRCMLGADIENPLKEPPCQDCVQQSRRLVRGAEVRWFDFKESVELAGALRPLTLADLMAFNFRDLPLGEIVLPGLRWRLRLHTLSDDENTRFLYRQFILSAWNVAQEFSAFLNEVQPDAVIVFNGMMFPEAVAARLARARGIRTITQEVAFQPFTAFFTTGEATAYPIDIPADFQLNETESARLDATLEKRFQGEFTMAGITFWPEMHGLDYAFLNKAAKFKQMVAVFTNVIFDTSQPHANTLYENMFAWLEDVRELVNRHPETLFVIRAHPDEMRPGTKKQARENVRGWVRKHKLDEYPNVVFIDSQEYISSYALIDRAKFMMVYNSSIGIEGTLLGRPVLCGGRARYTRYPTVFFPASAAEYRQMAEEFLNAPVISVPPEFMVNARRFLYYQLFKTALPFGSFLENHPRLGYVSLKAFRLDALRPENSPAIRAILDGVAREGDFLL